MRRAFAASLLVLLFSQSSGTALAGTGGNAIEPLDLATLIAPVQSAIAGSRLYALLTGTTDRYDAVHAGPPVMERPQRSVSAAELMHREHPIRPRIRQGTRQIVVMPDRSALDPHHRRLDPLAMRKSTLRPASPTHPGLQEGLPAGSGGRLQESLPASVPGQIAVARTGPVGVPPGRHGGHAMPARSGGGAVPLISSSQGTGIEHWWTYEERAIPGIGKAMLNVGTGNLLVAATDVDIHEQGIDLAFQRVYNSQSLHDANGDDGGDPAIFGNDWTNNFDANIVYDPTSNTITVYDLDGTACTYTTNVNAPGGWQPCTGEYATLIPTDSTDCTYAWTKPNGTIYWFHTDVTGSGCGLPQAKRGRIQQILARNQTNVLTFAYSYDSSGQQTSENITKIVVNHSDGDALTMVFGLVGTNNELATITLPDGDATLQYSYGKTGN
ncbi:MAG TPA: DUF6531 domain-containing protein, partial [Candidatus Cybelea sp.]